MRPVPEGGPTRMTATQLLEEISAIVRDPDLKVTAMRKRIAALLSEAGYSGAGSARLAQERRTT